VCNNKIINRVNKFKCIIPYPWAKKPSANARNNATWKATSSASKTCDEARPFAMNRCGPSTTARNKCSSRTSSPPSSERTDYCYKKSRQLWTRGLQRGSDKGWTKAWTPTFAKNSFRIFRYKTRGYWSASRKRSQITIRASWNRSGRDKRKW
jgi:hypothetical protein